MNLHTLCHHQDEWLWETSLPGMTGYNWFMLGVHRQYFPPCQHTAKMCGVSHRNLSHLIEDAWCLDKYHQATHAKDMCFGAYWCGILPPWSSLQPHASSLIDVLAQSSIHLTTLLGVCGFLSQSDSHSIVGMHFVCVLSSMFTTPLPLFPIWSFPALSEKGGSMICSFCKPTLPPYTLLPHLALPTHFVSQYYSPYALSLIWPIPALSGKGGLTIHLLCEPH